MNQYLFIILILLIILEIECIQEKDFSSIKSNKENLYSEKLNDPVNKDFPSDPKLSFAELRTQFDYKFKTQIGFEKNEKSSHKKYLTKNNLINEDFTFNYIDLNIYNNFENPYPWFRVSKNCSSNKIGSSISESILTIFKDIPLKPTEHNNVLLDFNNSTSCNDENLCLSFRGKIKLSNISKNLKIRTKIFNDGRKAKIKYKIGLISIEISKFIKGDCNGSQIGHKILIENVYVVDFTTF